MHTRIQVTKIPPESYKAIMALEQSIQNSGLDRSYIHLIKLRASQINGCSFCVDMHVKEARHDGFSEQWINLICAWKESPVYDARERALLGWTEAVTNLAQTGASDESYAALQAQFSEGEMINITLAIATINIWNRLAVPFRFQHPVDAKAAA